MHPLYRLQTQCWTCPATRYDSELDELQDQDPQIKNPHNNLQDSEIHSPANIPCCRAEWGHTFTRVITILPRLKYAYNVTLVRRGQCTNCCQVHDFDCCQNTVWICGRGGFVWRRAAAAPCRVSVSSTKGVQDFFLVGRCWSPSFDPRRQLIGRRGLACFRRRRFKLRLLFVLKWVGSAFVLDLGFLGGK